MHFEVCCTRSYKHLGTLSHDSGGTCPLFRQRFAASVDVSKSLYRCLFRHNVPTRVKVNFVHMYVLSKQLFDCGTWTIFTQAEANILQSTVMKTYRKFFAMSDAWVSDLELLCRNRPMAPHCLVRYARLSLLCRLLSKGMLHILTLSACSHMRKRA